MATFVDTDKEQREYDIAKKKRQSESTDLIAKGAKIHKETKRKKALKKAKTRRKRAIESAFGPMIA